MHTSQSIQLKSKNIKKKNNLIIFFHNFTPDVLHQAGGNRAGALAVVVSSKIKFKLIN